MDYCKRGHPLDGDNLRIRTTKHDRYVRRECRACARDLERVRGHRVGTYRRYLKEVPRGVLTREEELAALIEQQRRDWRQRYYIHPQNILGRRCLSLDYLIDNDDTNPHPLQDWWGHRSAWE